MTPLNGASCFECLKDLRDPLDGISLMLVSCGIEEVQESQGLLWVETIWICLEDHWGNAVTFAPWLRPARPNAA